MTQIEKQHFLGNYIGCVIEWIRESDNTWITTFLTASNFSFLVKKKCRIIAKSIESITDEDAIEVAFICGFVSFKDEYIVIDCGKYKSVNHKYNDYQDEFDCFRVYKDFQILSINEEGVTYEYDAERILQVIDFLRSKGYLLPFRQYSTEQLIESGIVKI